MSDDCLEDRAARAFAQSRVCRSLIQAEVLHRLPPRKRLGPERVVRAIDARAILDERTAQDLEHLLEILSSEIEAGTQRAEVWSDDPCDVSDPPRTWIETHRTADAEALEIARVELESLRRAVLAVLDVLHAARAVERAGRAL